MNEVNAPKLPSKTSPAPSEDGRVGLMSAATALLAAILSSACCWLPLALIGVGASVGGAATFFETYRVHFLLGAAALLSVGFYYIYFRKPACGPGEACAVPNARLQRLNRVILWIATAFILLSATFPEYAVNLMGQANSQPIVSGKNAPSTQGPQLIQHSYSIEGMTCEGCTVHAQKAISVLPGVKSVVVSYPKKSADVSMTTEVPVEILSTALAEFGYGVSAIDGVATGQ